MRTILINVKMDARLQDTVLYHNIFTGQNSSRMCGIAAITEVVLSEFFML